MTRLDPATIRKLVETAIARGWATKPGQQAISTDALVRRVKNRHAVDAYQQRQKNLQEDNVSRRADAAQNQGPLEKAR